jgi:hypothetical protein
MTPVLTIALAGKLAVCCACIVVLSACTEKAEQGPVRGVISTEETLTPEFWVDRLDDAERIVMERAEIDAQNARLFDLDPFMYDLRAIPGTLTRERVKAWVEDLADRPEPGLYDESGNLIPAAALETIAEDRNLGAIPAEQETRYGLVAQRADLRTFPTTLRVFRSPSNSDIDRFQESAVFPGTPVVIAHESRDGEWWFVLSPRYAAWVEKRHVAEGSAADIFGYADKRPYRVVTGATVRTVFNPEQAALSELQVDMGVRIPVIADWDADQAVHGQHPYSAHVIELPVRTEAGALRLEPALLQKNADTEGDYLPLTRGNIVRQSFKFLGERYGWGHSYNGRDCSGFVSEVYRSMGAMMPRNTSAQSVSPALDKRRFGPEDDSETRMEAVRSLNVGDLVYIPGHVMMVIGTIGGEPWVIHDTTGISYRSEEGEMVRVPLNAVSVTPLLPLQFNQTESYVDRMTSIVKIVPGPAKEAPPSL